MAGPVIARTLILVSSLTLAAAAQGPYTVVDLGILPGATSSVPFGMNELGDVAGWSMAAGTRAFLYTDATGMTDLGRSCTRMLRVSRI